MRVTAGVDYSMTSPAICIHRGDTWSVENCEFHYRTTVKKMHLSIKQFTGALAQDYASQEERFYNNAAWAADVLSIARPSFLALEGYAMGAKGLVFHIGENTGQLKQQFWKLGIPFIVPAPTVIKKFATGKGNANKEKMEEAFLAQTGLSVRHALGQSELQFNPSSDIIDAYFLCKYAFENPSKR